LPRRLGEGCSIRGDQFRPEYAGEVLEENARRRGLRYQHDPQRTHFAPARCGFMRAGGRRVEVERSRRIDGRAESVARAGLEPGDKWIAEQRSSRCW
jgi:hypothetical protein